MATEWFYVRNGEKHGPISSADLRKLAASGELQPTDLIWKQGMAQWVAASTAKGLFAEGSPAAPAVDSSQPGVALQEPTQGKDTPGTPAVGFKKRAAEAARCARATAERTQLVNVALPRAYAELGRVVFKDAVHKSEFSDLFLQIENLLSQRTRIEDESKARPAGKTLADKAKKAATDAAALAKTKAVDLQIYQGYSRLGEAVYKRHGNDAGPQAVTQPISTAIAKRDQLDEELAVMALASQGRFLTPKRIAIAAVGLIALAVVFGGLKLFSAGDSGFRRKLIGEWKSDSGLTLAFHGGSVVASGAGDSFKAAYTVRPASKQVLFKLKLGSETRSFSGTLEEDSLQLESSDRAGEVLLFSRVAGTTRNGGGAAAGADDLAPAPAAATRKQSRYFQDGYRAGIEIANGHKRLVAADPSQAYLIDQVRVSLKQELESYHPSQQDLIDFTNGKMAGFAVGMSRQ